MRGSIQVLRSELEADAPQRELMDIVLSESDRLNRIITDFLTYARPRKFSLAETDLREPLRETFALLRHSLELLDGHQLEEDLPEEPLPAMADAEGVRQVFWNLTRNALKAMPDGWTLRAEMRRTAPGSVRITFTDTGRGMTPAQVERLFEPFSSSTGAVPRDRNHYWTRLDRWARPTSGAVKISDRCTSIQCRRSRARSTIYSSRMTRRHSDVSTFS